MQYIFIKKNSYAVPSGYSIDTNNRLKYVGFLFDGTPAPNALSFVQVNQRPDLFILMDDSQFFDMANSQNINLNNSNSQTNFKMDMTVNPNPAVIPVETVRGQLQTGRVETPFQSGGEIITFNLSLDYSSPALLAPDASVLLGDAFDIIKTLNPTFDNLAAAIAGGLVVNGTYGAITLDVLQKLSTKGVRFHIFQGEASNASYWSNKIASQLIYANAQGSSQFINMDFQLYQDGSQFNDKIRQIPNFRFTISEYTAIRILVNTGEAVNFTLKFQSTGAGNVMELVR